MFTFSDFTYVFTTIFLPVVIDGYMFFICEISGHSDASHDFGLGSIVLLLALNFCNQQVPERVAQTYQISALIINYTITTLSVAIVMILMLKAQTNQHIIAIKKEKSKLCKCLSSESRRKVDCNAIHEH